MTCPRCGYHQHERHVRNVGRRMLRALGVLVVLWAIGLALLPSPGRADDDALTLSRALVAEAGPRLRDDHVAILGVLQVRADRVGSTPALVARRYCPSVRGDARGAHGRSVASMDLDGLRAYAPDVVALAEAWLDGERPPSPCRGRPDHWGAPYGEDLARAQRAGWRRVSCGNDRNAFWEAS